MTAYNSRHPTNNQYRACNFFNFYSIYKNGEGYQTVCSFYLIPFGEADAGNKGYSTGGSRMTIQGSLGYTRVDLIGVRGIVTIDP